MAAMRLQSMDGAPQIPPRREATWPGTPSPFPAKFQTGSGWDHPFNDQTNRYWPLLDGCTRTGAAVAMQKPGRQPFAVLPEPPGR